MPTLSSDERAAEHGALVKERRLDRGLNRPAFVREMARHGQEITPDYLNKIERGTAPLSRASLEVREAMRAVLGFSADEWEELTGLYAAQPTAPEPQPQPKAPAQEEVEIPDGLREAIDLYGSRFSDLQDPAWQRYLAGFNWRTGRPEEPERWLDLYRDLARAGVVPGGN